MSASAKIEIPDVMHGFHVEMENDRLAGLIDPRKVEQLSPEWFKLRVGRITGSRIGKVLGLSKYGSAEDVMRDMVREYFGMPSEFLGNVATQWGNDNEDRAADEVAAELEDELLKVGIIIHPDIPWLAESPDRILFSTGDPLQIKCPYGIRNDPMPLFKDKSEQPDYVAQMRLSCEVDDRPRCEYAQWTPHVLAMDAVVRDPAWFEQVMPRLEKFHDTYLEIVADKKLAKPYLKDLTVERIDPEFLDLADELAELKDAKDEIEAKMGDVKKRLTPLIENRTTRGGRLLVKRYEKQGSINWSKVQEENPERFEGLDLDAYRGKSSEQTSFTIEAAK